MTIAQENPPPDRRVALGLFAAAGGTLFSTQAEAQGMSKSMQDTVSAGGFLIVAEWLVKEGEADHVAQILGRYLPQAQKDPGVKLFLIARARETPAQFLFYELFVDEAAATAHVERDYFKALIADQALPLLSKRVRTTYALIA